MAGRLDDLIQLPAFVERFATGDGPALLDVPINDRVMATQMASRAGASH